MSAAIVMYTPKQSLVAYLTTVSSFFDNSVLINTTSAQQIIMHAIILGNTAGPGTPSLDSGQELVMISIAEANAIEMSEKTIFVFFIFTALRKKLPGNRSQEPLISSLIC